MEDLLKKFFLKLISDPLQKTSSLTLQINTIKSLLVLLNKEKVIKIPDWINNLTLDRLKTILIKDDYFLNPIEVILNTEIVNKNGKNILNKDVMHYIPIFKTVSSVLKKDKNSIDKLCTDRNEIFSSSSK